MDAIFDGEMPRARLAVLLKHFSQIDDDREPWWVVYPLAEALLLLTCATIASSTPIDLPPTRGSTSRRLLLISRGLPTEPAVTREWRGCIGARCRIQG
jgi:hypothetical protein